MQQPPHGPHQAQQANVPPRAPSLSDRFNRYWNNPTGKGLIMSAIIAGPVGLLFLGAAVMEQLSGSDDTELTPVSIPATKPAPPAPPPEPTLADKLAAETTVAGAVQLLKPAMGDHAGTDVSPAAGALALWMSEHSTPAKLWAELGEMPDSKRKSVMKDPVPFRGKKLCSRGRITQIFTDRSAGTPIYYGVLSAGWFGVVRYLAVGSSKGLVEDSAARFCGVIIGLHSYGNTMGGSASGVEVVGLFDLPENRK